MAPFFHTNFALAGSRAGNRATRPSRPGPRQSGQSAVAVGVAGAAGVVTSVSSDPFTKASSQHATEVEPDTFAAGSTVVAAFQAGRFFDGGASDIGYVRSTNGGSTWSVSGFLPGLTASAGRYADPSSPFAAVSDRRRLIVVSNRGPLSFGRDAN